MGNQFFRRISTDISIFCFSNWALANGGFCIVSDTFVILSYLSLTTEEVYVFVRTPEFDCLSVCVQDYSKMRAWMWMLRVDVDELINF